MQESKSDSGEGLKNLTIRDKACKIQELASKLGDLLSYCLGAPQNSPGAGTEKDASESEMNHDFQLIIDSLEVIAGNLNISTPSPDSSVTIAKEDESKRVEFYVEEKVQRISDLVQQIRSELRYILFDASDDEATDALGKTELDCSLDSIIYILELLVTNLYV